MIDVGRYRRALDAAAANHRAAVAAVERESLELATAQTYQRAAAEAQRVLQTVAAGEQTRAHLSIARIVTKCVRLCGWDYDFKIDFTRKRGRTDGSLGFYRSGFRIRPAYGAGGGPVDMAALALRVAALLLSTPRRRPALFLDEPFRGVNGESHRKRAAHVIETLADKLGIQFVIATGHDWLRIGRVHDL